MNYRMLSLLLLLACDILPPRKEDLENIEKAINMHQLTINACFPENEVGYMAFKIVRAKTTLFGGIKRYAYFDEKSLKTSSEKPACVSERLAGIRFPIIDPSDFQDLKFERDKGSKDWKLIE